MQFIRQKLSVLFACTILVLFCGMGLVESLHHHVLDDQGTVTVDKSSGSASVHKYQRSCELCKGISSHHHLYQFDFSSASFKAINTTTEPLIYGQFVEALFDSTFKSLVNKGPPSA